MLRNNREREEGHCKKGIDLFAISLFNSEMSSM